MIFQSGRGAPLGKRDTIEALYHFVDVSFPDREYSLRIKYWFRIDFWLIFIFSVWKCIEINLMFFISKNVFKIIRLTRTLDLWTMLVIDDWRVNDRVVRLYVDLCQVKS